MNIVEYADGTKKWYVNGNLHRIDGPAVEYADGDKEWWFNGQPHRENGPANEKTNGYKEWWLNGKQYSYEEWLKIIPNNLVYLWRCYCGND